VISGHTNGVNDVCFSLDGSMLASGSTDGAVRLWNARTGEPLREIPLVEPGSRGVARVRFSADGSRLIVVLSSLDLDNDGQVWSIDLSDHQAQRIHDGDDPSAVAQGDRAHRFRGLVQSRHLDPPEFVVKDGETGKPIAWAPYYLGDFFVADMLAHPSGRMWAGRTEVLRLEDAPGD
jgi:WD40 repeat protein